MSKLTFHYWTSAATMILAAHSLAASTPAEISLAGFVAGRNLFKSDATSPQTSFDDQCARMVRIASSDRGMFTDPAAEAIWSEAQLDARRALATLARIAEIDNKKPSDWDVVVSSLKAAGEDTKNKDRQEWGKDLWVRLLMEFGKTSLQKEFRTAEWALDTKLAELSSTVRPPYTGQGIGIVHLPSWQGAYDNDLLILKNQTGQDLTRPAVFVTFQGRDGKQVTHLHHALMWANNQQVYFKYPYYETDYAPGQTVNVPTRVEVSVIYPDGLIRDAKVWSREEYDNTVRGYINDLKLTRVFLANMWKRAAASFITRV